MLLKLLNCTIRKETKAAIFVEVDTKQLLKHQAKEVERRESIWLPKSVCIIDRKEVKVKAFGVNFIELKEKEIARFRNARLVEIKVQKFGED